jgi:hypothetical protein
MRALSRFGELAWFSLTAETHPVYGYSQVPYMGWRYASPREGVAQLVEEAIKELPTQVEWTLDRSRRNWLLLPSRILSEAQGLENPAFADAVHSINIHDQEFCFRALADIELIIQCLQETSTPED